MLWNKSVPWILLPFTFVYLASVGMSLIRDPRTRLMRWLALSIVVIYGNGWVHKETFPTLAVTLAYEWMWLGSKCIGCGCSRGAVSDYALSQRTSSSMPWSLYGCSG
jgi:hypothetical protein